jgi:flagellar hook-basal body complex protein FliE
MQIDMISAVDAHAMTSPRLQPVAAPADFWQIAQAGLNAVNTDLQQAHQLSQAVASGEQVPAEQLMLALEQASLSLKLASQVKDRLVGAYQELLRMQV